MVGSGNLIGSGQQALGAPEKGNGNSDGPGLCPPSTYPPQGSPLLARLPQYPLSPTSPQPGLSRVHLPNL